MGPRDQHGLVLSDRLATPAANRRRILPDPPGGSAVAARMAVAESWRG